MHIALENPAALRSLLGPAFRIPFLNLGLGVAMASVLGNNARSLALVKSVGFREACRIRDGYSAGVDLVIFEMQKADCRWVPGSKEAAWAA
jgi:RimJ/RimL family protein N-acetyltransferase